MKELTATSMQCESNMDRENCDSCRDNSIDGYIDIWIAICKMQRIL